MKALKFANATPIDLVALTTMGVSVKTNDNPIGYFGTGLKYAMATLLRTGHTFRLIRNKKIYNFTARDQAIRGEKFGIVYMNNEKLGFTTELGKNWTPLEAYRELASNCIDEEGVIDYHLRGSDYGTIIEVEGDGIDSARAKHSEIFLSSEPKVSGISAEAHTGESSKVYYRGLLAMTLRQPGLYTYNILTHMDLTEDRTFKYSWSVTDEIARLIGASTDYGFIVECLLATKGYLEHDLTYLGTPGPTFMKAVGDNVANVRLNLSALEKWQQDKGNDTLYRPAKLDKYDHETIDEALELMSVVGIDMTLDEFMISTELTGAAGLVRDGEIVIARTTLDKGARYLASTLFEEWIHKVRHYGDYTREFQDFTIDTLFGVANKLKKELDR